MLENVKYGLTVVYHLSTMKIRRGGFAMRKPIDRFKDLEQLKECAKYYIELLGLQDWGIQFRISNDIDKNNAGQNDWDFVGKMALITLVKDIQPNDYFLQPQELVLIHELLHCKYPIIFDKHYYECVFLADYQHQVLEDMARAIFKARFNLTNEYFTK